MDLSRATLHLLQDSVWETVTVRALCPNLPNCGQGGAPFKKSVFFLIQTQPPPPCKQGLQVNIVGCSFII